MTTKAEKNADIRAEKRDAILAAARTVFSTRGVVNVTMEDIAKAAHVSKGALYLHFASKDELYLHLSALGGKELLEVMQQACRASNGFERMSAMAHGYARYCSEDPMRFRLDVAWLAPGYQVDYRFPMAQAYRSVITEVMRICVETFAGGQADGSIRADLPPATTVYQIWGSILGMVILQAKGKVEGPTPPQADPRVWSEMAAGTLKAGNGTASNAIASNGTASNATGIDVEGFVDNFIDQMMTLIAAPAK